MYGFNLGVISGLSRDIPVLNITLNNGISNTYTVSYYDGIWRDDVEEPAIILGISEETNECVVILTALTSEDVGDVYNITLSTESVEENFKSAVETVLVDNGLISEPETIFDETLTLTDDKLYYELPSDFPDGWYENAVCSVNGMEIPKDPESSSAAPLFSLSTDTINVDVGYRSSMDELPAQIEFSYYDVPNDAIIPGDYQVKIVSVIGGGGSSSDVKIVHFRYIDTDGAKCDATYDELISGFQIDPNIIFKYNDGTAYAASFSLSTSNIEVHFLRADLTQVVIFKVTPANEVSYTSAPTNIVMGS